MNATLHCQPPPTDGQCFIGQGRIICYDEFSTMVEPWAGRVMFRDGELCWAFGSDGLAVRCYSTDILHLDRWVPIGQGSARRLREAA